MKTKRLFAILITGSSLHLSAQGPPQGPPPDPIATILDKNGDQKLSSFEIRGAMKALLKLDKDKDGILSADELRPQAPKGRRREKKEEGDQPKAPPTSPLMNALDRDQSGDLSREELASSEDSLRKLDRDENGRLSTEEAGLERPGGQGGGQGPGGPPPGGEPGGPPRRGPGR